MRAAANRIWVAGGGALRNRKSAHGVIWIAVLATGQSPASKEFWPDRRSASPAAPAQ
ncbi:MAG: hypothetical protein ABL909_00405 [Sphingopyxis sp.]